MSSEGSGHLKTRNSQDCFPTITGIERYRYSTMVEGALLVNATFSLPHDFALTPNWMPLDTTLR